ncbi:Pectin lyase fold/virulence factor [Penicillium robsamsonii]|uniref:Pectin lyase fold/virulence factor n=1 Tax=Penicillium robsamsonii TaxID=1792511 RepID=UPI0025486549|nr:Pectin lyase fold/virulence factor [Penicillium robsamsonii]KAJ5835267.1 Pectin lyase fold/virulence factor [Penicillium robsamsonii]
MRSLSYLAVAAIVSPSSGFTWPLHWLHASSSDALPSTTVDASPSNIDELFDLALASSLADLTDALSGATVHQHSGVTTLSTAANTLCTDVECLWKAADASIATPSPDVASSSSDMTQASITAASTNFAVPNTLATSPRTPLPKTPTQSTRASAPTPSPISEKGHSPATKTCAAPTHRSPDTYWLDEQDHNQQGAGFAPYAKTSLYPVYRNVMDYSVVNDGSGDQTPKLQKAIYDDGVGGSRKGQGVTRYPAQVYLPGGVYQLGSTLNLTVGTIIVGNPLNPPIIKAAPGFHGDYLIMGYDSHNGNPETSFATLVKNVVVDTTALKPDRHFTALQWGVAQGSGLTNVKIRMPTSSTGHTGIEIKAGSTIAVTDVDIIGGVIGIKNSNQQVNFKNINFQSCRTAFSAVGGWTVLLQQATFDSCGTGIDMTGNGLGSLVLLDSTSTNTGPVIRFYDSSRDSGNQNSQFLIQNLKHDTQNAIVVDAQGKVALAATSHIDTWVWGTVVPETYQTGASWQTKRPAPLLVGDKYFTKAQPTYQDYSAADIVNVKTVSGHTVKGDGKTDDTKGLNAILAENADSCKITYIPFGVYRVSDTLVVPVGTRIVGEAWSVISGYGDKFKDSKNPRPVVQLGSPGDIGVIEIQDMRFSVGEILPGAKIIEINAAGDQPGDVGLWNTMAMVGGTVDTSISGACTSQDTKDCMAAFMVMHLTKTSSAYIENFWGWTADHNLDSESPITIISTGRGILVESTKGTWLTGTGSEHHWLYNYNFHNAQNVFAGLLQTETPYMQGQGEYQAAPAPWTAVAKYGDPDFSWCAANDQKCRTAIATNVDGGSNIALYNSAAWAFFDGFWNGKYDEPCTGNCQTNMMRVTNDPQNLVWYSISTRMTDVMVLDGKSNPRESNHKGGWEGIIQVYGQFIA